jgi:hypothetical protein
MTTRSSLLLAALSAAAVLAFPAAAAAAGNAREAAPAKGKAPAAPLLLTPAQLRECLDRQQRLRASSDQSVKEQADLKASKAEIDRLGVVLKEQLETLDRTSVDAVAAYNAQVDARDKLIDTYQESVPAFNTKVEALKAEQAAYSKACENRRYDEADEISIRKGK